MTDERAYERELRSKLKQVEDKAIHRLVKLLDERLGKQSETIHRLRAELALIREEHSRIDRGELRRLERENEAVAAIYHDVVEENMQLHKQLLADEG